jgi:hypothetical protein
MNWTSEKRNCRNYQDLSTYDFGYEIDSLTKLENLKKKWSTRRLVILPYQGYKLIFIQQHDRIFVITIVYHFSIS